MYQYTKLCRLAGDSTEIFYRHIEHVESMFTRTLLNLACVLLRERPFDIYGGGGGRRFGQKKSLLPIFCKNKSLFLTENLRQRVLNMVIFKKKVSPECREKSLLRG